MTTHTAHRAFRAATNPVSAVVVALLAAAAAQAQVTAISETQLNALLPTAVPITGTPPQTYPVYTTSVGPQTMTVTNNGNGVNKYIERRNQLGGGIINNTFGGDFPIATPLLRNVVSSSASNSTDGLLITFSAPVSAFGLNFDPTLNVAPTDFTFQVFEGLTSTPFAATGIVNNGQGRGTAPFWGVQEARGNLITSLLIVGAPSAGPFPPPLTTNVTPNDFAVGLLRFNISASPVPEPGSIALLLGMTVTGAGCLARGKRSKASRA